MSSAVEKATAGAPPTSAPLNRALDQSERVRDKVGQAASDLAVVNAVLKDELAEALPLTNVVSALDQSEAVEVKVQEAAEELVAVNNTLSQEIEERHVLEERLSKSDDALAQSRADERKFRHSAMHDSLTGLPNLTLFTDRVDKAIAQAKRHNWRLAVIFIDLNGFKMINDTHGHETGDHVLQMVGQRLQGAVRAGDTVSRRSGDEFLLLMLEAKNEPTVAAFARKILDIIGVPCGVDGVSFAVTASIGIALYPDHGSSPRELLKGADAAMYVSKQQKIGPAFYSQAAASAPSHPTTDHKRSAAK